MNSFAQSLGAPTDNAFNSFSQPGFSIYGTSSYAILYPILAAHGNLAWVSLREHCYLWPTPFSGGAGATAPVEQYLGGVFNHGGTYVNIYGWSGAGSSGYSDGTVN